MYPHILKVLIEDFAKLPGIGEKTAERLVMHLATTASEQYLIEFGSHLSQLKSQIKFCQVCGMLTSQAVCPICLDESKDKQTIMVVSDSKDVFSLEKMGSYNGLYHVLNGLIDFSRGIDQNDLNIDSLLNRLSNVKEIIIATNGTVEGELTAQYLKSILSDQNILVSRLGYGIPVGVDLKYADEQTLNKAVENRQKY